MESAGANLCGNMVSQMGDEEIQKPQIPGDVAQVYSGGQVPVHLHSAIYLGCGFYLQRNGNSDIQVSQQKYIDNFAPKGRVRYVRPQKGNFDTFYSMVNDLQKRIPASEDYLKRCFP